VTIPRWKYKSILMSKGSTMLEAEERSGNREIGNFENERFPQFKSRNQKIQIGLCSSTCNSRFPFSEFKLQESFVFEISDFTILGPYFAQAGLIYSAL
jgi:hypothetical protein